MKDIIYKGTELKLNISIEPIANATMDDFDFSVELYCTTSVSQIVKKEDAIRVDANNYIVICNTDKVGSGELKARVSAVIPDGDMGDARRTEVQCIDTGIKIVRYL